MKILIACERSGVVRRAFAARGHDAWSCDIERADDGSNHHITGDVRDVLHDGWDMMMVAHPPCTRLCNSGVRWLTGAPPGKIGDSYSDAERAAFRQMEPEERTAFLWRSLDDGAALFSDLWNAPIPHVAIENPVMHQYARDRIRNFEPPAQTVQPWWFGCKAFKATSFWLRGLEPLVATDRLTPPKKNTDEHKAWSKIHHASPGKDRSKERSQSFPGIAAAMADQWGGYARDRIAA